MDYPGCPNGTGTSRVGSVRTSMPPLITDRAIRIAAVEWTDEGIILGTRRHGEANLIVEAMTRDHGRHMGLVRGGRSQRLKAALQPGNAAHFVWRARLDEHLGTFAVEPTELRAARLIESPIGIYGVQLISEHLRLLPERDPHRRLYEALLVIVDALDDPLIAGLMIVRFEIMLLDELGFGLDLTECAATGGSDDLIWVSPKSGRAVSREAGAPYAAKLLPLPNFLIGGGMAIAADVGAGFRLTEFFLARHVWEPRGKPAPEARAGFIKAFERGTA